MLCVVGAMMITWEIDGTYKILYKYGGFSENSNQSEDLNINRFELFNNKILEYCNVSIFKFI